MIHNPVIYSPVTGVEVPTSYIPNLILHDKVLIENVGVGDVVEYKQYGPGHLLFGAQIVLVQTLEGLYRFVKWPDGHVYRVKKI